MTFRSTMLRHAPIAVIASAILVLTAACAGEIPPGPAITLGPPATPVGIDEPQPELTIEPSPDGDPSRVDPLTGKAAGASVTPTIYMANIDEDAGILTVVAYVPSIFEDGGTCTATVTNATVTLTQDSPAEADATGTACGLFTFSLADIGRGEATITTRYESADHQGESAQLKVDVP